MKYTFFDKRVDSPITNKPVIDSFISIDGLFCQGGFKYSYCPIENYYFINPQPDAKSMDNFYNSHGSPLTQDIIDESYNNYDTKSGTYDFINHVSETVKSYKHGSSWLDFGCGPGLLLFENKDHYDVCGVEISNIACANLEQKGIKSVKNIEELKKRKFDIVTSIDVIEHMPDPKKFILDLLEHVNDDGILFLRFPVIDGMMFSKNKPEKWKFVYSPYHLHMLSTKTIKMLMESLGLTAEIVEDSNFHASWGAFYNRFLKDTILGNNFFQKLFFIFHKITEPLLKKIFYADCCFLIIRK